MTFGEQNSEAEAHSQLDYALERGINFIDTAEMYPVMASAQTQGSTERYIGSWLKKSGKRGDIVLASKVAGPNSRMHWIRKGKTDHDAVNIRAAVEDSLRRLQTEHIDLYQLHWPSRNLPIFGASVYNPRKERAVGRHRRHPGRAGQADRRRQDRPHRRVERIVVGRVRIHQAGRD